MSAQFLQLSFNVDQHTGQSKNSPQYLQSSNKLSFNSVSTDYSKPLKQCRDKPTFKPPQPKFLEDEAELDDNTYYSHNILVTTKSFPEQTNPDLTQKAGSIPKMFSTKTPSLHNLVIENTEFLKPEDLMIDIESRPRAFSSSVMASGIKDSDDEGVVINSYDSGTVRAIDDMKDIDNIVFEQRREKRALSINSPTNMCSTAIMPSRFALDATNKNNLLGQSLLDKGDRKSNLGSIQLSPVGLKSPDTLYESQTGPKKIWGKLSYVIQSLSLIQRHEANHINIGEVDTEINNFQLRTWKDKFAPQKDFYKAGTTKDAFEKFRKNQLFWDSCRVGSKDDARIVQRIIDKDPRKNMIDKTDPEHLLNQHDLEGYAPLHLAAINGNLEIAKILIQSGADHLVESKANKGKVKDIPIELAVRWNHATVVEYLLEKSEYPKDVLVRCLKNAENNHMKELIKKSLNSKKR